MSGVLGNPFRSSINPLNPGMNVADWLIASSAGGWTLGATQLDNVDLSRTMGRGVDQQFEITAVSFTAQLTAQRVAGEPTYGKLGRVIAGFTVDGAATGLLQSTTYQSSAMLPLPREQTFTTTLWDPTVDALPPIYVGNPSNPPMLSVAASLTLPEPIAVGGNLLAGLWIAPSLQPSGGVGTLGPVPSLALQVFNAQYAFTYK